MRLRSILGSGAASVWRQTKRIGARAFLGSSRLAPKRGIRRDDPAGCLTGEVSATPPRVPLPSGLGALSVPEIYAGFAVWGHPRVQVSPEHERLSGGAGVP